MILFFLVAAGLCLLYYVLLACYIGPFSVTALTWLVLGAGNGALSFLWRFLKGKGLLAAVPLWLKVGAVTTLAVVLLLFLLVQLLVVKGMFEKPKEDADYLIVLGAKVQSGKPSHSLRLRLDAAAEYALSHPKTFVIVSGGQGADEEEPEAQVMYRYLVQAGIEPTRIVREKWSATTMENLRYSLAYVQPEDDVVIVTNGFHMFRALSMAEKLDEGHVSGLPAANDLLTLPNSLFREFFALIKAKWLGHL